MVGTVCAQPWEWGRGVQGSSERAQVAAGAALCMDRGLGQLWLDRCFSSTPPRSSGSSQEQLASAPLHQGTCGLAPGALGWDLCPLSRGGEAGQQLLAALLAPEVPAVC